MRQTKEKIEEEHKMAADSMKLIAYGKVLEDDSKQLKEYSIKDGDFLVVMIAKVTTIAHLQMYRPSQQPSQRRTRRWRSRFNSHLRSSNSRINQFLSPRLRCRHLSLRLSHSLNPLD